jgi:hypothetical protein
MRSAIASSTDFLSVGATRGRVRASARPQADIGIVLWSLSVSAGDWQTCEKLTRLCTIPEHYRLRLHGSDRALMVWMTRVWPSLLGLSRVVQPDTILRWHRAGFRAYWRWKSRGQPGRPKIEPELRELIRRMSKENPLWGAPRIHGELLKLGFEIAESTVSRYMIQHRGPELADIPVQPCGRNRGDRSLRGSNPNVRVPVCVCRGGSWTSTAALVCGDPASDRGVARTTDRGGIPDFVFAHYNETRTHLGLSKDAPRRRAVQRSETIVTTPVLSGLHHRYARI